MTDTHVQHFDILEHLGGGPMGRVYRARDTRDDRIVALKFLPFDLAEDPEARERYLREAQAASALHHANICTVYEIGEADDGRMFAALRFYEGETLKKKLSRDSLPIADALSISRQIAEGLGEAYRHGILHRDLVPANVLVTDEGQVRILDFGLAKMVSGGGLTQVGRSLGTPQYMSPEQIRGETLDHTADLWSLGALLYEMVTGNQPFAGPNLAAVLMKVQKSEPTPPSELRPGLPTIVDSIVGRLLAKRKSERYPSYEAFVEDLDRATAQLDGSTPETPSPEAAASATSLPPTRNADTAESLEPGQARADSGVVDPERQGFPWTYVVLGVILLLLALAFLL